MPKKELNVLIYPDKKLRKRSIEIKEITGDLLKFLTVDFYEFMKLRDGVGLAAPQTGIFEDFFVMDTSITEGGVKRIVINPKINSRSPDKIVYQEGCLSVPDIFADVERPKEIEVEYINGNGEKIRETLRGMNAVVFQHEYDHLMGILFIDRLSETEYMKIKPLLKELAGKNGKKH